MKENGSFSVPRGAKRVLAVSIGGLGDTVLFSPVFKGLRTKYPGAVIELLAANELSAEAYGECREINCVTVVDTNVFFYPKRVWGLFFYALRARIAGGYDVGVFTTGLNPKICSFMKLMANIRFVCCAPVPDEGKTDLMCNVELARHFDRGITENDAFVPVADLSYAEAEKALSANEISVSDDRIIVIYPSRELRHRPRWPIAKLVEVVKCVKQEEPGSKIVVVGSADEAQEWRRVDKEKIANAVIGGELTIGAIASLFSRCSLVLGNDGGVMHVAGTTGCPVVDIAPNVPVSYKPPGGKTTVLRSGRTCCDFPRRPESCKSADCVSDITVDHVLDAYRAARVKEGHE